MIDAPKSPSLTSARPLRGILFKVASVCLFISMASLIKATADQVPPGQAVFFRSFFALPVILFWLARRGQISDGLKMKNPLGHFWRGLVGTSAMALGFAALGLLPLPEVTAIGYAAPLMVVIFAAMFLGEDVRAFRLSMVAIGMSGVLIVLSPRLEIDPTGATLSQTLGAVLALMSAVGAALAHVFVRKLVQTESTTSVAFWFSVSATILSLLSLPWGWVWPDAWAFFLLVCAGLLGGLGQICLTTSYRLGDASLLAPFDYVSMLIALAIGYFIFAEVPTPQMLLGAAVLISAGIAIIWREHKLGLERARQRRAVTPQG